jgi:hypothetical protein
MIVAIGQRNGTVVGETAGSLDQLTPVRTSRLPTISSLIPFNAPRASAVLTAENARGHPSDLR